MVMLFFITGFLLEHFGKKWKKKSRHDFEQTTKNFLEQKYDFYPTEEELEKFTTPVIGGKRTLNYCSSLVDRMFTDNDGVRYVISYRLVSIENDFMLFNASEGKEVSNRKELSEADLIAEFKKFFDEASHNKLVYVLNIDGDNTSMLNESLVYTHSGISDMPISNVWSNYENANKFMIENTNALNDSQATISSIPLDTWLNLVKAAHETRFIVGFNWSETLLGLPSDYVLKLTDELQR